MAELVYNDNFDLRDIEFQCIVCVDILKAPASLECGHTLCLMCADRLYNRICPICRQPFTTLSKNLLLCSILAGMFGDDYVQLCEKACTIKKYYGSDRFDTLLDMIIDLITDGDQNTGSEDTKGTFITVESLIQHITTSSINKKFNYIISEIKLCLNFAFKEKDIFQVHNLLFINGSDWICDKLEKYAPYIDSDVMLLALSGSIKSSIHSGLGERLKKKRRTEITTKTDDIEELEEVIHRLIVNKKIEI